MCPDFLALVVIVLNDGVADVDEVYVALAGLPVDELMAWIQPAFFRGTGTTAEFSAKQ